MLDRHGRLAHADVDGRRRPSAGFRLRGTTGFERAISAALADCLPPVARVLAGAAVDVVELPPTLAGRQVPLATVELAGGEVQRLVVHRRPAEQRAVDRADLVELLRDAIEQAVSDALGIDPHTDL